jgi:hypothetical protein
MDYSKDTAGSNEADSPYENDGTDDVTEGRVELLHSFSMTITTGR